MVSPSQSMCSLFSTVVLTVRLIILVQNAQIQYLLAVLLLVLNIPEIKLWIVLVASFGSGIATGLLVFFFIRPLIRKKVQSKWCLNLLN